MKSHKIILFILVCLSFSIGSKAQTTMQTALNAGTRSTAFNYVHTVNTGMLTTEYNRPGQPTNEVYYKLTLSVKMTLFIGHCGSEVTDTYVSLLNASGTQIAYNDNPAVNDRCTGKSLQAVLVAKDLAPGTYYIVSKGVSENGLISTRIEGDPQTTGNTMTAPFDLGTKSSAFSYTSIRNTHLFSNNYGRSTNEVFYKVTLGRKMGLSISHCGSETSDTYLYVLNASGTQIAYNDDPPNDDMCEGNAYQSYLLLRDLAPGTYYIVSEGYSKNGYISTRIDGITGDTMNDAIDLGSKSAPFSYADTKDTRMYTNSYGEQSSNDVFYKFTLTKQMPISISHCGSEVEDTYLYLLNASGTQIAYNDDPDEETCGDYSYNRAYSFTSLTAGTYYVVSKGYAQNGPITTRIEGYNITETGNTMGNPIEAGTFASDFSYTNRTNTGAFTNNYGSPTNDVFYKFTITAPLTVIVNHCYYTTLDKTSVYLLNASGVRIAAGSSSDSQYGDCPSAPYRGCLKVDNLPAGTYYVVSEGYSENGIVGTTIKGSKSYGGLTANGDRNYILTVNPTVETEDASTLPSDKGLQTIRYFDGLGRAMQTVQRGITPSKGDLIDITEYDAFGREYRQWLPGIKFGNNGAFVPIDQVKTSATSVWENTVPYNEIVYESSPLNRVIRQYGPGSEWRTGSDGKYVKTEYLTNNETPALTCKKYRIDTNNNLICTDSYANGQLYVLKTTDEDGKATYEFRDKFDRVVLFRQENGNENLDTYSVYDDFGDLRYVLSPAAVEALGFGNGPWYAGSDALRKYAYVYTYDKRRRCSQKQMPGADPVYYVYDKADHLVLTQDGEQRKSRDWTAVLPDMFGRPAVWGIVRKDSTLAQLQVSYENKCVAVRYTGNASTYGYNNPYNLLQGMRYLNVSWYDHYKFLNLFPATEKTNLTCSGNVYGTNKYSYKIGTEDYSAKGLSSPSGSISWMTDDANKKLYAAVYYDVKGRPVQAFASNHIGGFEKEYTVYSFTGKPVKKILTHTAAGKPSITQTYRYTYDHADRLKETYLKIDQTGEEICLSTNYYDEPGRLYEKALHTETSDGIDKYIDYEYDIRGRLTDIYSGFFKEKIYYAGGVSDMFKSFSGNIGAVSWKTGNDPTRYYGFTYDGANRMKKAQFTLNPADLGISGPPAPATGAVAGDDIDVENYTEEILQYDRNGNIKRLKRDGLYKLETVLNGSTLNRKIKYGNVDDLTLSYNGNQLTKVTDASTNTVSVPNSFDFSQTKIANTNLNHYVYDANGRMVRDYNKSIHKTSYDCLNLPQRIYTLQGHSAAYSYDASGVKRRAAYRTNSSAPTSPVTTTTPLDTTNVTMVVNVTDYCGNIIYKDGTLNMILTPEGYVSKVDGKYVYHYFFKDHLGNVRTVVNENDILEETNDYYPFGTPFAKKMNASVQPYKYNGKEQDRMHGMNMYDYGKRWMQTDIPVWPTPDPLAENTPWMSPYSYCLNNPMRWVDLDGRQHGPPPSAVAPIPKAAPTPVIPSTTPPPLPSYQEIANAWGSFVDERIRDVKIGGLFVTVIFYSNINGVLNLFKKNAESGNTDTGSSSDSGSNTDSSKPKIEVAPEDKIDRDKLDPPSKSGNAPTFKDDETPVEIHHEGQDPNGPFKEMHWQDHRGQGNDKINHPNKGSSSQINRSKFNQAKQEYWKKEYGQ